MEQATKEQPAPAAAAAAPPVLPWMRVPLNIAAGSGVPLSDVQGLHPALLQAVRQQLGFVELFPVQVAVWRGLAGGQCSAHDMCICAPTGSGKTLAYALPMLNAILTGCDPGSCAVLQGLVVLPTRSLAVQVHAVLASLGAAAGIRVALAAAQEGVEAEAAKLFGSSSTHPRQQPGAHHHTGRPHVLVATPGRLIAHLQGGPGRPWTSSGGSGGAHGSGGSGGGSVLSLQHLKFLVVDEADRLLRQDYHGWLPLVLERLPAAANSSSSGGGSSNPLSLLPPPGGPHTPAWGASPAAVGSRARSSGSSSTGGQQVLKLVVSATLTRDPSKLMRLELCCPRYIALTDVARRYTLPPGLQQYRLVVPAQHKPLALVGLLHRLGQARTVVFASSLDMTHRLYLLLAAVPGLPGAVAEYSSHVSPEARATALSAFKQGGVQVLVTSDAMARGMDVSGIAAVVNYDPPTYPKNYVHRAGRTARAGSSGAVYSLLKPEDVVHFNGMVRKMQGAKLQQLKLGPQELQGLRPALRAALQQVQALVALEQQQEKQAAPGAAALNKGRQQQPQPQVQAPSQVMAAQQPEQQQQQQQQQAPQAPQAGAEVQAAVQEGQPGTGAEPADGAGQQDGSSRKRKKRKV